MHTYNTYHKLEVAVLSSDLATTPLTAPVAASLIAKVDAAKDEIEEEEAVAIAAEAEETIADEEEEDSKADGEEEEDAEEDTMLTMLGFKLLPFA